MPNKLSKTPPSIGKYRIESILGRGAQAVVYLGQDQQLGRKVAIKSLAGMITPGEDDVDELFSEARTLSEFQHANIVTIYDLGVDDWVPYIVLEYIDGSSLKEKISSGMSYADKVEIMQGCMQGLATVHAKNIAHCDIKPANIMVDRGGTAKITDFGLTGLAEAGNPDMLYGTPQYMAPEYIQNGQHRPVSDVFSLGLVFYELLTGRAAIKGSSVYQVLHAIANTKIAAPSQLNDAVDQQMDTFILKCLEHDPRRRFQQAGEMLEYFRQMYSKEPSSQSAAASDSTVAVLLRRIKSKKDFPILARSLEILQEASVDQSISMRRLSSMILQDVALTHKLLALANSPYFNHSGSKVSSITRAINLIGLDELRRIASSIMLFEHLQDKNQAEYLKDSTMRAMYSAEIGYRLAAQSGLVDTEEAYVCALLQQLGELLVQFYFYEDSKTIDALLARGKLSKRQAARQVLGVEFHQLGAALARDWGYPEKLLRSMPPLDVDDPLKFTNPEKNLRAIAQFASGLADCLKCPFTQQPAKIQALTARFAAPLKLGSGQVSGVLQKAAAKMQQLSEVVGYDFMRSMYAFPFGYYAHSSAPKSATQEQLMNMTWSDFQVLEEKLELDDQSSVRVLNDSVQEITTAIVQNQSLNEIVQMVAEAIYRAMSEYRVLVALLNRQNGLIQAQVGYGEVIDEALAYFSFAPHSARDVFALALRKNADLLLSDISQLKMQNSVPDWHKKHLRASSFALFPLQQQQKPVGLLYIDGFNRHRVQFSEQQLSAIKALRNQIILALNMRASTEIPGNSGR